MLDIDTTMKTVFGHQEGAEVGYNPHKPGRPSHAYHTYWIARLRLCLDVEVRPGKPSSSSHGMPALWELIDSLPLECRPHAIRGDCNYGNEANMVECEKRGIPYLFKLRQTANIVNSPGVVCEYFLVAIKIGRIRREGSQSHLLNLRLHLGSESGGDGRLAGTRCGRVVQQFVCKLPTSPNHS
jgi:hypothetical protein